jgi:hypothetical protein
VPSLARNSSPEPVIALLPSARKLVTERQISCSASMTPSRDHRWRRRAHGGSFQDQVELSGTEGRDDLTGLGRRGVGNSGSHFKIVRRTRARACRGGRSEPVMLVLLETEFAAYVVEMANHHADIGTKTHHAEALVAPSLNVVDVSGEDSASDATSSRSFADVVDDLGDPGPSHWPRCP